MARLGWRWILCLPLLLLLVGCSVERQSQRISRLSNAVRSQPQIQPPADYVPSATPAVSVDPIAKADVLVFATRPGDAVVSMYATIRQAVAQGRRVVIVYVTSGDAQTEVARALAKLPAGATPTPEQYLQGAAVQQELALAVAEVAFGMQRDDVVFLAYPDGVLHEMTAALPDDVVRSPFTEKDGLYDGGITPYRIARSGQAVPYSFNAILHDLNDVLVELNPSEIYLPSPASADATVAAAGGLIARSLQEVVPPDAQVFAYSQEWGGLPSPDRRVLVADPTEKQHALGMYAARFGAADWPSLSPAQLEEELFWVFDYTKAT